MEKCKLWQLITDMGGSPFKSSGYDIASMDEKYIGNNGIALCSALTDGKSLDTSAITNYVNKASDLEKNVVLA